MISLDKPKISIYLTNRCNLNCKHCFIEGSPQNHIFLSWSKIKNLLNFYKNQFPIVEFTGGEAILSPYINKSIKLAKHLGFYVGVSTNGLDKTLISNYTPTQIDKLTFSLDGSQPKTHDFLRGRGVFWHCIENIKQAIKKGFRVEVVYTVHKLNINQINSTVDFLDNIGVKKISFNFISNRGHATFNQKILITGKDWITVRKQILAKLTTKQISLRYPIMFATPAEFKQITKSQKYFCQLIQPVKVEVYPNGNIYHCCLEPDFKNLKAGKVTNKGVEINTDKEIAFVKKYKHLSCPIYQTGPTYTNGHQVIPICLYYKYITRD